MRSISIFILLIYWSIIILAPVTSKEKENFEKKIAFATKIKPNK